MKPAKALSPELQIVRPLLDQPRAALEAYARARRLAFREDSSNTLVEYDRNWIRHEILPALTKRCGEGVLTAILRTMEIVRSDSECAEALATRWLGRKKRED